MVNGQSCSFCSQVQTYSLWASSSWSQEIRKKGNCSFFLIYFPCSRVNTHWLWDLKSLWFYICFVQYSFQTVTRKVNKRPSRKCCFTFSHKNSPNVRHLFLRHIALVGNFTILKFAATFFFTSVLRWYSYYII